MGNRSASVAVLTAVAASTSSQLLLAANGNRVGVCVTNDSASANLYLALGAIASTTLYTAKIPPGDLYELPDSFDWYGAISGVWDSAVGSARISEVS